MFFIPITQASLNYLLPIVGEIGEIHRNKIYEATEHTALKIDKATSSTEM